MEDMTNSTHRKFKTTIKTSVSPTFQSLFLFVTSIARTNLESELVQRGGSLCSNNVVRYKPRRDCIGESPFFHGFSLKIFFFNIIFHLQFLYFMFSQFMCEF